MEITVKIEKRNDNKAAFVIKKIPKEMITSPRKNRAYLSSHFKKKKKKFTIIVNISH